MFQAADQRYSKPLPGEIDFYGSKTLVQYVVLDYNIYNKTAPGYDNIELVQVEIN